MKMPDLLTLAAMKAFALGHRSKWKDYLDLYFILKFHHSFVEISIKAKEIFKEEFIEKQFIAQLGYFKGINYSEEVTFLIPNPPTEDEIKNFLTEISLSGIED
nr:nucleotidyl transferase AbiEii/AbiGii toxin family protein [Flavobacterium sp.]